MQRILSFLKKAFILILSFLYLTSTVGATVHFHYCMDKLVGWGLESEKGKTCDNCGMADKEDAGCCKDEQKQVKLEGDQKVTPTSITWDELPSTLIPILFQPDYAVSWLTIVKIIPDSHAPPREAAIAVYLRHCTFRI